MAINTPIINATTNDRRKLPDQRYQPILVSQIGPLGTGESELPDGTVVTVTREPLYEGQCMIHWRRAAGVIPQTTVQEVPIFEMYCVVTYEGNLTWAKVDFSKVLNDFGQPWSPMGGN